MLGKLLLSVAFLFKIWWASLRQNILQYFRHWPISQTTNLPTRQQKELPRREF